MTLPWLNPERPRPVHIPNLEELQAQYWHDLWRMKMEYDATLCLRDLADVMGEGGKSDEFTSPKLQELSGDLGWAYEVVVLGKNVFNLMLYRPEMYRIDAVARIVTPTALVEPPKDNVADRDLRLIEMFYRNEVKQPQKDSGQPPIEFPRVPCNHIEVRVYRRGRGYTTRRHQASDSLTVEVPMIPSLDNVPPLNGQGYLDVLEELYYLPKSS